MKVRELPYYLQPEKSLNHNDIVMLGVLFFLVLNDESFNGFLITLVVGN